MANLKEKKVLVVYGGIGSEREVSLRTGQNVYDALKKGGYDVEAFILNEDNIYEILSRHPDICFNAVHGKYGEDGVLQGFLEMAGIAYTGSGVASSMMAYNKYMAKLAFEKNAIPTPKYYQFGTGGDPQFMPCVIKPAREGSTVGVSIVHTRDHYKQAGSLAKRYDDCVLVEEYIDGKEITVSIVNSKVFSPILIKPLSGFYDYASKYTAGSTEYLFDTGLSPSEISLVKATAMSAYRALNCSGAARVDIIFREIPYVLEVNTVPGLTETSNLPKAAEHDGISALELFEMMLSSASSGQY
ncbi:MAG: D-alanine--D-alanine ligase [Deferribacteraceae bacterium]|jgi:D-alanine-D-alanine ligase|nr:D-alanine--D-alanine ligase [Deferribacteraceae bacterium]